MRPNHRTVSPTVSNGRCAVLLRKSKDDRTEEPTEVMLAVCLRYLESKGYRCDNPADVFIDVDETGGVVVNRNKVELPTDRPAVQKLLANLGHYQAICTYKYDRLSRNQLSIGILPYLFISNGLSVLSPKDGDLDTTESKLLLNMKGFASESEWESIRQRSMDAIQAMRAQGKIVGQGRPRYGYRYEKLGSKPRDGSRRIEDPDTAPIVRRIFAAVAEGQSLRSIARSLTVEGIPGPTKASWNTKTIQLMIQEPSYKGEPMETGRQLSVGVKLRSKRGKTYSKHIKGTPAPIGEDSPAIVTKALWQRANKALVQRYKPACMKTQCETWLRGRIFCGLCKKRMSFERRYDQWTVHCGNKRNSKCFCQARLETVSKEAMRVMREALANPDLLRQSLLWETDNETVGQLEKTLGTLEESHTVLTSKKNRLIDLIVDESDTTAREAFRSRLHETTQELDSNSKMADSIRLRLEDIQNRRRDVDDTLTQVNELFARIQDPEDPLAAKVADMVGLRVWIAQRDSTRVIIAACVPDGVTVDSIEALGSEPRWVWGRHIEPCGRGHYVRRPKTTS